MIYTVNLISNDNGTKTTTDVTQYVLTGFSFVEKLDESLDTGQITLRGLTTSTPYTMFDTIQLLDDGTEVFSMRISGDLVTLISKDPELYEHNISLVEHTKILELYTFSGKTFRQPLDGTVRYYLYDVIDILNRTAYIDVLTNYSTNTVFDLPTSGDLYDLLTTTPSPEFTFNNLTLRRCLQMVCDYVDGIPRLTYESNVLTFTIDFVSELKDVIGDNDTFLNKVINQEITLHATEFDSEAFNLVSGNIEEIDDYLEYYPSAYSWITGRSDSYFYNYLESFIPTPKPINDVKTVIIKGNILVNDATNSIVTYNSNQKYYYYDTVTDFPSYGNTGYFYVAEDTGEVYLFNGTSYISQGVITPITPNISFYEDFSSFPTAGSLNDVIYIARDTENTYRWNGSAYVTVNNFNPDGSLKLDCSDRIFEYNTYLTKEADGSDRLDPTTFYQSNCLFYKYKEKNIQLGETYGLFDVNVDVTNIIKLKSFELLQEDGIIGSSRTYNEFTYSITNNGTNGSTEDNLLYRVLYYAIPLTTKLNSERINLTDVRRYSQLVSNQQSRILNFGNFADNLQFKVNRIGNSDLNFNLRITDLSSSQNYNIGDYNSDRYIVTEKEMIFFKDFVDLSFGSSRDFNRISQFISVNSEIRQWEIGERNTLERKIKIEEFIEIDVVESGNGSTSSVLFEDLGIQAYLETFDTTSELEPVRYGVLNPSDTTNNVILNVGSDGGGNALYFPFEMINNISSGKKRDVSTSQFTNEDIKYSDDDGIFSTATFYLSTGDDGNRYDVDYYNDANELPLTYVPASGERYIRNNSPYYIEKDSAEEFGGTIVIKQFSKDIVKLVLGRQLSRKNRLINENPPSAIYLHTSTTEKATNRDTFFVPDGYTKQVTQPTLTISTTNKNITVSHANLSSSLTSWILTDENDRIILAVNQDGTLLDTITFDFNNKRSGINYKY